MDNQYDVPSKVRALFEQKQKQRAEAKEYYQRLLHNPYRAAGEGLIDPSLIRFNAAQAYRYKNFKASPSLYFKAFVFASPFFLMYYLVERHKTAKESLYRSGSVKYEDRYRDVFF